MEKKNSKTSICQCFIFHCCCQLLYKIQSKQLDILYYSFQYCHGPVRIGNEFPDMRRNERAIKYQECRHCQNNRSAQGEKADTEQGSLVHFYTQATRSGIGGLVGHLLMDEARTLGGGKEVKAKTFLLWSRRGDSLYCSRRLEIH